MTGAPGPLGAEEVIREIEGAFEKVALGAGASLQVARAIDDYASDAELQELRRYDVTRRWQDIPDREIEAFSDVLPFMDAEGFRFHIPRFMIYALSNAETSDSFASDAAIYNLNANGPRERFRLFSGRQRMAAAHFLEFCANTSGDFLDRRAAQQALTNFWNRYLQAGE